MIATSFFTDVHVMCDIETLDVSGQALIPQIAGVAFRAGDKPGTFLGDFKQRVDITEAPGSMSPSTVRFWLRQSKEAQEMVFGRDDGENGVPLKHALHGFTDFYRQKRAKALWGHGATFDPVILGLAYQAVDMRTPWGFRDARDTRTVFDMVGGGDWKNMEDYGPKHDALADSKRQAVVLQRAVAQIRGE